MAKQENELQMPEYVPTGAVSIMGVTVKTCTAVEPHDWVTWCECAAIAGRHVKRATPPQVK